MTDIFINEIHPNPTDGFEWVELYNNTNEVISTSRVNLYDQTSKNLKFSTILFEPKSYVIATSSSILNNGGDTVILEQDGVIIESLTYGAIATGRSYSRCDAIWIKDVLPTYGLSNGCDESVIIPTTLIVVPPTLSPSVPQKEPTALVVARTHPSKALKPIDFNAKHGNNIPKATSSALVPSINVSQQNKDFPTSSYPLQLLTIGMVSLIQCIFLVYLIIKRIRMDVPFTQNQNE